MQRVFVREGNLDLDLPLRFKVYGDSYEIGKAQQRWRTNDFPGR